MTARETPDSAWSEIGEARFVSLSTFRKNGAAVATPVWIARDGDELVVTTERSTGKVKRVRNNSRVTLTPCSRMGNVEPGAVVVDGFARLAGSEYEQPSATGALKKKYGLEYRVILGVERLVWRLKRKQGDRVILRISASA